MDKVEDEVHFLLYCPLYKTLREKYMLHAHSSNNDDIQPIKTY